MKEEKKIEDYLHLYLGCECVIKMAPHVGYPYSAKMELNHSLLYACFTPVKADRVEVVPILRPLSDMTEEIEYNGKKFVPLKVIAGWAGTCSPDDWIVIDKYTVEHYYVKGCTLSIYDSGDLIMKASKEWKHFEVCSQQILIFKKMLEWGFDIFGLIESGLALDKTKI